jgi:hypothetical protein
VQRRSTGSPPRVPEVAFEAPVEQQCRQESWRNIRSQLFLSRLRPTRKALSYLWRSLTTGSLSCRGGAEEDTQMLMRTIFLYEETRIRMIERFLRWSARLLGSSMAYGDPGNEWVS